MSFIFKILQTVTKIRYLALGASGLGLYSLKTNLDETSEKYRNFKSYFPNFNKYMNIFKDEDILISSSVVNPESKKKGFLIDTVYSLPFNKKYNNHQSTKINEPSEEDSSTDAEEQALKAKLTSSIEEIIDMQRNFQAQLETLENENKRLRKHLSDVKSNNFLSSKQNKSLIEMYSEILDILTEYDSSYSLKDCLPRVVVVGDQSSGKTSVLEMLAKVRIFPRGAGEMMTRSPVVVTLSEGPSHIASFKGSSVIYDLTKETEVEKVRLEIETKMKSLVDENKTVSEQIISLSIKGPGLQRMVLVDLPGIINTVTSEMSPNTKDNIINICQTYLSNPNSIILCVHDGSIDAERSLVTDLVSKVDPTGQRTICVLTKIDLAEKNHLNQERMKKLLSGKLFPMKAIEYFGVVTGTGDPNESISKIKFYEEEFFKRSSYLKNGIMRPSQVTVHNLSYAISKCFWKMVLKTINSEYENLLSRQYSLSVEWRNNFPGLKELTRDELFERAKNEIIDDYAIFANISPSSWESMIFEHLSTKLSPFVFSDILLKNYNSNTTTKSFKTNVDVALKKWLETTLSTESTDLAKQMMLEQLASIFEESKDMHSDSYRHLIQPIKDQILDLCNNNYHWNESFKKNLNVIQKCALDDRVLPDQNNWDVAAVFFEDIVSSYVNKLDELYKELLGPSKWERIFKWKSSTPQQNTMKSVKLEIEKFILNQSSNDYDDNDELNSNNLSKDDIDSIWRTLQSKGVASTTNNIVDMWNLINQQNVLMDISNGIQFCRRNYNRLNEISHHKFECNDIVLFWRFFRMIQLTANSLRQEIVNNEILHLEENIKEQIENFSSDELLKKRFIVGKEIDLAEEMRKVSLVKQYLETFIKELDKDKIHKLF